MPAAFDLAWSPDGSRIVFSSCRQGIGVVSAANGGPLDAIYPAILRHLSAPDWSPDGSRILVAVQWSGQNVPQIIVLGSNGSSQQLLIAGGHDPAWSPDGTRIAFVH